jgi:hypothetical protein
MFTERKELVAESKEAQRLKPDHKLILAELGFLGTFALMRKDKKTQVFTGILNEGLLKHLTLEYVSIQRLLTHLVGKENLIITATSIKMGKETSTGISWEEIRPPTEQFGFHTTDVSFLSEKSLYWPRDTYTLIDEEIFAKRDIRAPQGEKIHTSNLGEGGCVLTKENAVLVTPNVWKNSKHEILALQQKGYKTGMLPLVDPAKQKYGFVENHIDGHAALIKGRNSQLVLVVADSYCRQGDGTKKLIRRACETINAEMVEVDDHNLPPLAFNILQLEDNSTVMTSAQAKDLEFTLSCVVGADKVFTTEIPLIYIPGRTGGGIRCLTNLIPSRILNNCSSM